MSASSTRPLRSLFAERLIQAQDEEKLDNHDLERDTGISLRVIQKYRAGDSIPREENLFKLSRALKRPVSWFFSEDGVEAA